MSNCGENCVCSKASTSEEVPGTNTITLETLYNLRKWDKYFYDLCNVIAGNSKCLSRTVGAVLVKDKSIVSTGYNGPPRGVPVCNKRFLLDEEIQKEADSKGLDYKECAKKDVCPRRLLGYKSGEGLEWCVAGHGERNALINAARMGIATFGAKLYMNCGIPCSACLVEIINAGISEIIVVDFNYYDRSSDYLLKQSGLKYRRYIHL